jgi:hypothetical protein
MKRLYIFALTSVVVTLAYSQAPVPVDGWPYITSTGYFTILNSVKFSNCNSTDGEFVYFSTPTGEVNKCHFNGIPYLNWPFLADSIRFSSPQIIVDLDLDGLDEVVALGIRRNDDGYLYDLVYIFDDDGRCFPGFPLIHSRMNVPNVADFDNDGQYELIYYSLDEHQIYSIDTQANQEPGWPIPAPDELYGSVSSCGSAGDLDGDGDVEFVLKGLQNIYAYNHDGSLVEGFPIPVIDPEYVYNEWWGVTLGDVDHDGDLELVVSATSRINWVYRAYIAVYDHTGDIRDNWPRYFDDNLAWQMPVIADINGDNELELGFTMDQQVYFIDLAGNNLPGWPAVFETPHILNWMPMSDLIVVDIDGDRDCEIFGDYNALSYDNSNPDSVITWSYLFATNHAGEPLPGFPITVHGEYLFKPPTFSLDSVTNQLFMGIYTLVASPFEYFELAFVEMFQFPDSTGPTDKWPMLCHDNLMTRNYNFVDNVTSIRNGEQPLPKSYVLKQNYPNPFNAKTSIEFALPEPEHVIITVYDLLGRRVEELADQEYPAGKHQVVWQADEYASGLYFYVMRTESIEINRKMMLLK